MINPGNSSADQLQNWIPFGVAEVWKPALKDQELDWLWTNSNKFIVSPSWTEDRLRRHSFLNGQNNIIDTKSFQPRSYLLPQKPRLRRRVDLATRIRNQFFSLIRTKLLLLVGAVLGIMLLGFLNLTQLWSSDEPWTLDMPQMLRLDEGPDGSMDDGFGSGSGNLVVEAFNHLIRGTLDDDDEAYHHGFSQQRILKDGKRKLGDVILKDYKSSGPAGGSLFGNKETVRVFGSRITSILCRDLSPAGATNFKILDGGVGEGHVFIDVIPQFWSSFNVSVIVTGFPQHRDKDKPSRG